jgi:hypothetical protein
MSDKLEQIVSKFIPQDLATIVCGFMPNIITVVVDDNNVTTFNNVDDFISYVRRLQAVLFLNDRILQCCLSSDDEDFNEEISIDWSMPTDIEEIMIMFCGNFVLTDPKNLFRNIAAVNEDTNTYRVFNLIVHGTLILKGDCHAMFNNRGICNFEHLGDNNCDFSGVDVSKVTNMSNMFEDCKYVGQFNISGLRCIKCY